MDRIKTPECVLDINSGQLWCGDDEIKLSPKAFALLRFLMAHPGCLLSKNDILDGVWPNRAVNEEVVRDCIRDLRKALSDDHNTPRFIETVHGRGYRYIGSLRLHDEPVANKPGRESLCRTTTSYWGCYGARQSCMGHHTSLPTGAQPFAWHSGHSDNAGNRV